MKCGAIMESIRIDYLDKGSKGIVYSPPCEELDTILMFFNSSHEGCKVNRVCLVDMDIDHSSADIVKEVLYEIETC